MTYDSPQTAGNQQEMNTGSPSLMIPSQSGAICIPKNGALPCLGSLSGGNLVLVTKSSSEQETNKKANYTFCMFLTWYFYAIDNFLMGRKL